MRLRSLSCATSFTLAFLVLPLVHSQTLSQGISPNINLQNALVTMRGEPVMNVQLTGTTKIGSHTSNYYYDAYLENLPTQNDSSSGVKLAIFGYLNGTLAKEWIGDGTNLWQYTVATNQYMVVNYTTNTHAPTIDTLLQNLSGLTDQYANPIVTLFRQAYSSTGAQFHNWLGGGQLVKSTLPNVITYATSTQAYSYNWVVDSNNQTALQSVNYYSDESAGGYEILTHWQLTPTPITTNSFSPSVFKFVPPVSAIPISVSK